MNLAMSLAITAGFRLAASAAVGEVPEKLASVTSRCLSV